MYLKQFSSALREKWKGSLFTVSEAKQVEARAKEYLYRLRKLGEVERVYWGWYYIPKKQQDVWDFLANDKRFKVLIKQTAASVWNYDFIHRNVYRLAVEDASYKRALEKFGKDRGWIFEVEDHDRIPYEYKEVDRLFIETPESCLVNCIADWSFLDAFAVLYFRKDDISFDKVKELARWKRISKTDTRVWNAIKYGCNLFNRQLERKMFDVKTTRLEQDDVRELVEEAVKRVIEFA
ncbi:hypothetical protein KEJ27_06180 [Candidatus Bathyarchaeota archaeon]|nr:hypothetical protein [Candidatus Bathyarchaeota archaeon]MBS7613184.1 hypothetical protein [Candidatus Bathyarchaeota archaeon]MBS7618532.1 hypothetical protein [Candidatus Bathyarchaeota archaeon]